MLLLMEELWLSDQQPLKLVIFINIWLCLFELAEGMKVFWDIPHLHINAGGFLSTNCFSDCAGTF